MKNRIAYLDASIVRIDSVIAAYTAALKSGRMTADTVSGPAGITTLFRHQEELSDRKLEEIKALNLLQPVDLIYGFIPAEKPAGRDLKKLMWAVIASMALGVFVAVARRIAVYE